MNKSFEERVIQMLLEGKSQPEISQELKKISFKPNSLSSIEKFLNRLKKQNNANTYFQLGAIIALKKYIRKKA
ncbi:hypothetical protein OHD16_06800 [Sphingobacterium sp. ML3W]|uniref:helix-turn-helix transcriptional regulator n=1 Tax=Sphingobacterium sp. ML3W TaxID=1538644 RepID=UPI00249B7633|nr:hypothetical protein [Sphingobacterium sp. ML3W]WFA79678.1 hypothetical protein OGI71_27040 [Sphingobacterium sp. ML3W]